MADGSVKIDIVADDSDIKKTLNGVEGEASDAAGGLDKLSGSAEDAGKSFGTADVAIGNFIGDALTNLKNNIIETVGNIVALADETREYREDMAKLDTAFTTAGHSTETAQKAYDDFYKILGESDRSVEAVNHLAELTKNEEEVAQWGTIAAGVTAKFGDSLPIEGLTEAANETAKVGAVTGPLADALNWAGISEDEFNKKLAACNSEQERASLITNTLNKEYEAAATEYNELTANAQAARDATNRMEQAQAALGAAIEPVTTAWTNMKANALQWFVDVGFPALQTGWQWIMDNLPAIAVILGGIATAWLVAGGAQTIATAITTAYTAAQTALNASFLASPITWVILGITALVAGFMLLWNNCEGFRKFWIGLWEIIKTAAKAVADWFVNAWNTTIEWLKGAVAKIKDFFTDAWEGIKNAFSTVKEFFAGVWAKIQEVFETVKTWFSKKFTEAKEAITAAFSNIGAKFGEIWTNIKNAFVSTVSWFSTKFTEAKTAILSVFANIGEKFSEIKEWIFGAFSNIKDKFFEVGDNILTGIWDGILAGWDWLVGKVKSLAGALFGAAQEELDSHSPSRKFAWLGETAPQGLGVGWEKAMPDVEKQITGDIAGLTARIQSTVSAENARMAQGVGVRDTGFTEVAQAVGMQTAGINSLASEYRRGSSAQVTVPLILDGRELGRAIVDLGNEENARIGTNLAFA